jgi:hypothetical protein
MCLIIDDTVTKKVQQRLDAEGVIPFWKVFRIGEVDGKVHLLPLLYPTEDNGSNKPIRQPVLAGVFVSDRAAMASKMNLEFEESGHAHYGWPVKPHKPEIIYGIHVFVDKSGADRLLRCTSPGPDSFVAINVLCHKADFLKAGMCYLTQGGEYVPFGESAAFTQVEISQEEHIKAISFYKGKNLYT